MRAWERMSEGGRSQFAWPHPGIPRVEGDGPLAAADSAATSNVVRPLSFLPTASHARCLSGAAARVLSGRDDGGGGGLAEPQIQQAMRRGPSTNRKTRRAMLSAPGLSGRSAGVGCAPRRDLRQERHCRGRWVRRELFASPTLLGLVRRVLSTSCWGSGEKGDGSGRAPRAWEVLASPEKFERAGAWNTSPNVPSAQSFPADALSRSMRAPEDFGIHFYSEFPIISDFRRSSRAARRAWRRRSTLRAC